MRGDCAPHHSLGRRARGPAAPLAYGAGGRRASCARHPVQPAPPLLGHPALAEGGRHG